MIVFLRCLQLSSLKGWCFFRISKDCVNKHLRVVVSVCRCITSASKLWVLKALTCASLISGMFLYTLYASLLQTSVLAPLCYPFPDICSYCLALGLTFLTFHPHTYVRLSENTQVTGIIGYIGKVCAWNQLTTVGGQGAKL